MTQTAHTPGPWYAYDLEDGPGHISNIPNRPYERGADDFITLWHTKLADNGQMKANARLIAAAPEMLEALKMLRNQYLLHVDAEFDDIARTAVKQVDAAIAKAEGRS